jgi:tetratricopeptide (TPR) repeat protein
LSKQPKSISEKYLIAITERGIGFYYAIIAITCFVVFGNTLLNEYGLDDHLTTNHNPLIEKGIKALPEIFTTNYIDEDGMQLDYRPLVKATYAIEYSLFGWNPHISHFINILLYALACCVILKVLVDVLGSSNFAVVFVGVLIYVVHPVHTEVVASLKNRDELLVLLFTFLSAYQFISHSSGNDKRHFTFGLLFFLLALFSKISCLPFVASVPLLVYFKTSNVKKSLNIFAALAFLTAIYYAVVISSLPGFARQYEYVETPFPYLNDWNLKLGTAFYSLWWYLRLLVFPQPLSFYYGFSYVELKTFFSVWPVMALIIHIVIAGVALLNFKRNKLVSFFLLFYLIQISLYSNLVLPLAGMVAERALMFASLSFCIGLSYLLIRLFVNENQNPEKPKSKKVSLSLQLTTPRFALIGVVLVIFSGVSIARNADWKDTITLFEADMPHLENSARANYMMAKEIRRLYRINNQLTKEKLSEESAKAIHYYNQAIKAYPEYAQAMEELGMIYAVEQRNISMAIPVFEKAISIDSTLWRSASNLGMAYQISKDTASSVKWYEHSLKIRPNNPKVLVELAKLYYTAGRKQDALKCNSQLMKLNPESNIPYYNYAIYYMMEQDTPTAVKYFEQDIKYGEKEEFPYYFLFTHYMQQSDTLNALRIKRQAQAVRR